MDDHEKIIKVKKVKICEICGCTLLRSNYKRHLASKKHKDVKYIWEDRFEFKPIEK